MRPKRNGTETRDRSGSHVPPSTRAVRLAGRAAAGLKPELQGHRILHIAQRGDVGAISVRVEKRAEQEVEDIEGMAAEVQELPATGLFRDPAPRKGGGIQPAVGVAPEPIADTG